jgi:hypothetical protein
MMLQVFIIVFLFTQYIFRTVPSNDFIGESLFLIRHIYNNWYSEFVTVLQVHSWDRTHDITSQRWWNLYFCLEIKDPTICYECLKANTRYAKWRWRFKSRYSLQLVDLCGTYNALMRFFWFTCFKSRSWWCA